MIPSEEVKRDNSGLAGVGKGRQESEGASRRSQVLSGGVGGGVGRCDGQQQAHTGTSHSLQGYF